MRKVALAVIGLALIGAGVWFFVVRDASRSKAPVAASKAATKAPDAARPRAPERDGQSDISSAVLVDDDPKGSLRLEGQVIDADEKPVAGATVVLASNPPRLATSGEDGGFAFDNLVGRPYTLTARAATGVAGPITAHLTDKSAPVVLRLAPGAKVVVDVVDASTGKPLDGATVELRSADAIRQTTKDGSTTFTSIPAGGYQLAAWAPGRAVTHEWLGVAAGDEHETLRLEPGAAVKGRVVDPGGAPVSGARVTYHGASDWSQQADARFDGVETGKDGVFEFPALPAGSFRFAATHAELARSQSPLVTLDGKTETRDVVITLGAGATVRGIVVDAHKQPVPSARVRIGITARRQMIFEPPRQAYTDATGAFEIKGLPRRELSAVAMHESGASQTADVNTTNGNVEGVTLTIDVTGSISGIVVDPAGNALEGVQVSAGPNFRDQGATMDFTQFRLRGFPQELTDGAGTFTLTGLAVGSYMISASRSTDGGRGRRGAIEGTVAQTGTSNLKIVLQPEGGVKGKVAFADGSKPTAFTLQVGFAQQSFSGTGEFEMDALPPQKYELSVRGPQFQTRAIEITVDPAKTTDVGTITVVKGRVLGGIVVSDGQPVPNATVYAGRQLFGNGTSNTANFGPMGQGTKQATTDASGHFSISGFNLGDLAIVGEHPDIGRSQALRIPTNMPGQGDQLVLELQKFGSLKGVLRVGGKPTEGVFVSCQSTSTPGAIYAVASGPDGAYRYDKLAPDLYKISATVGMPMMGMKFYSKEILVPPGKEVTIDLTADPGAITLAVTAVAKTGKVGVANAFISTGVVAARTATELGLRMAASGPASSQWVIIRNGEPAKFNEVAPGSYSVCIIPFPAEVQGMGAMGYADRHSDSLPAYCQQVKVQPSPATQTASVTVEIPAFEADQAGSGAGSGSAGGSGSQTGSSAP
jgi:protocatechuate 3,4-dioxygenase beta subunit